MEYQVKKGVIVLMLLCVAGLSHAQVNIISPKFDHQTEVTFTKYSQVDTFDESPPYPKLIQLMSINSPEKDYSNYTPNPLADGSAHFKPPRKKRNFFVGVLLGLDYNNDLIKSEMQNRLQFGFIPGQGFAEFKQAVIGIASNVHQSLSFKVGFVF